jgi:pyridoxal phosphate enzyme (YggS family)
VRREVVEAAERCRRDPESVRLIAVSKTFPAERIREAYDCGQRDFGENKVQEFRSKLPQLELPEIRFHMIGHLQTNKVSQAIAFDCIQTIDSERLARKLNESAAQAGKSMPVLIEVKLGDEDAKTGVSEQKLVALVTLVVSLDHLDPQGLMIIPPWDANPQTGRPYFRRLRELQAKLMAEGFTELKELSMGMSRDFPIAIEEGATMVRVGTAIFGRRVPGSAE